MSWLSKIFNRNSPNPADDRYFVPLVASSSTGLRITPETAMRSSAVVGCVRVLAETIASLPLLMYQRESDTVRKRETQNPLYRLLHDKPNRWQTAFEFREMLMGHVLLRGNGYAQKIYSNDGSKLLELIPLDPSRTRPKQLPSGDIEYHYAQRDGRTRILQQDDVFHLRGMGNDGIQGVSVISYAQDSVGLAVAAEEYGARVFANDASPGGVLKHPAKLSDEAHKRIQESWSQAHQGLKNAHKAAILEEGMEWVRIGMSSEDTQWLENRRFQTEEIARLFRVPLHMLQDLQRATFSNIEQQDIGFVKHTILPWCKRWENAIQARILDEKLAERYYFEFLVDGLLRGDFKTRQEGLSVMRNNGIINADEWRALENMNPQEEKQGSIYLVPANMVNAALAENLGPPNAPTAAPAQQSKQSDPALALVSIRSAFLAAISERMALIESKEQKALASCLKKPAPLKAAEEFLSDHRAFIEANLQQLATSYAETVRAVLDAEVRDEQGIVRIAVSQFAARHISRLQAQAVSGEKVPVDGLEDIVNSIEKGISQ